MMQMMTKQSQSCSSTFGAAMVRRVQTFTLSLILILCSLSTFAFEAIPVPNGDFSNSDFSTSWTNSGATHVSTNAIESYNTTFDIYQTLTGLDNGLYRVTVRGFYRNGGEDQTGYTNTNQLAVIYADGGTEVTAPISKVDQNKITTRPSTGDNAHWFEITDPAGNYFLPNRIQGGDYAIHTLGLYENNLYVSVTNNTLKIGARKTVSEAWDWCYFDDFTVTKIDGVTGWNGTNPFNFYRVRNKEYSAYLHVFTEYTNSQWWGTTSTLSDATLFLVNQNESGARPTEFSFYENTKPKYLQKSGGNSGTQEDPYTWNTSGDATNGYKIYNDEWEGLSHKTRYLTAKGANIEVDLPSSDSKNNKCLWFYDKATNKTVKRFYLYHPGQGVFLTHTNGLPSITTDPEEARLVELSSIEYLNISVKFVGTSYYLSHNGSSAHSTTTAMTWNLVPTSAGFSFTNSDYHFYPSDKSTITFTKDGLTETQESWMFISEEEYREMVANLKLDEDECYNLLIPCETGRITPTSVANGAGTTPPNLETANNGSWYTKAHDKYINFKAFASPSDVHEVYYKVYLPASTYTITLWMVKATNTYMNLYYVGALGTGTVTYDGDTYTRVSNGHLDFRGTDNGGQNSPFYTKSRTFTIEQSGYFLIGLTGCEHAGFDQILFEAHSPVFCDQCYQYLRYYDTDATSGEVTSTYRTQFVTCENSATSPLVVLGSPDSPTGYTFHGWNTRSDKQGMVINAGDELTLPSIYTNGKNVMSLYAMWEPTEHNITLDKGTTGTLDGAATIKHEATKPSSFTKVTYTESTGHYLKGYYTSASGGQKVLNVDGSTVASVVGYTDRFGKWIKDADCTLYAQYGNKYTITFSSETAGTIRVLDDMGNELSSGAQVVEGTVLTLQARTNDGEHRVYQWSITSGSNAPEVTTTSSGLMRTTITDNTVIAVTYTTQSTQICSDTRIIECEDEWVGIGGTYGGSVYQSDQITPDTADHTNGMKILSSDEYCVGFTGKGYVDLNKYSGEVYFPVTITKNGTYQVTIYSNNGNSRYLNVYKKNTSGRSEFVYYEGEKYTRISSGKELTKGSDPYNDRTTTNLSLSLTSGEHIFSLWGNAYAKFDRIEITYQGGGGNAFCHDKEPVEVEELPWSAGSALDHGDAVLVTPKALLGCVTSLLLDVKGMDGDLLKISSGGNIIMNNVAPGEIELKLTKEMRQNGILIEGIRSVSLGEKSVILGDNKGHAGIFVEGKTLYDANGVPFVMRGTNVSHTWFPTRTISDLEAIASYNANTVRIVLSNGYRWTWTDKSVVAEIIAKCEELGLCCVLEVHDGTGNDDKAVLVTATNYWLAIKDVLMGHESTVIINIANEWMEATNNSNWSAAYQTEIARLRAAGLHHCIMVDANGYGQGSGSLASDDAVNILNNDPDKNVVFSLHMYNGCAGSESDVTTNIDNVLAKNLCLVIGEYGWAHMEEYTDFWGKTKYRHKEVKHHKIISYTEEKHIGALSWSWYGNSGGVEYLDMVNSSNVLIATQSTAYASKGADDPSTPLTANWGQDVVDSWANAMPLSNYCTDFVLQVHTIEGVSDDQSYTIWASSTPLNMSGTTQLSLGPEHFVTAEVGDNMYVYRRSVSASATASITKSTNPATALSADGKVYDINSSTELTNYSASPQVTLTSFPITDTYYHTFTAASLAEAKKNGMVIRGANHTLQTVTLEASECHHMRIAPDTLRVDEPLKLWVAYEKELNFGEWEHLAWFTGKAWSNLTVGDIIRVRVEPSDGYTRAQTRVTFRCYANSTEIDGRNTWGDMCFDPDADDMANIVNISALGGKEPDAAGFVDIRVANQTIANNLKLVGSVVFGENAKLISVTIVRGKFVIPTDSAALVPDCGVDTLIIYQGGQARNKDKVRVYKRVEYIRNTNGEYTYSTFNEATGLNVREPGRPVYENQMNKWYTFTVPFDVDDILLDHATNGKSYSIHAKYDTGDGSGDNLQKGSFFLKYLSKTNTTAVNEAFRQRWLYIGNDDAHFGDAGKPKAEVPYIILFSDQSSDGGNVYYKNNKVIRFCHDVDPAESPLLISGIQQQFKVYESGIHYYYYHNNSMYDMQFDGSAYLLNDDCSEFVLTEDPVVHPFECYVQATDEFKQQNVSVRMGRLAPEYNDSQVATSFEEMVNTAFLLADPDTRAYDIMGREYDPKNLPSGIFIIVNNDQVTKIIR